MIPKGWNTERTWRTAKAHREWEYEQYKAAQERRQNRLLEAARREKP